MPVVGNKIASQAVELLATALPISWRTRISRGFLVIGPPRDTQMQYKVVTKSTLEPADITALLAQEAKAPGVRVVVCAPFLSPRTRERLREAGFNYIDLTGNTYIVSDRPALFVVTPGAERNPRPSSGRIIRSLKGTTAGRVVRALCDFKGPVGIRELAGRAKTTPGYASKLMEFLQAEELVVRTSRGAVDSTSWERLLRRWAQDYDLVKSNQTATYLEPRGLRQLVTKLQEGKVAYAMTGSLAAAKIAPIAASRLAVVYVGDLEQAGRILDLRATDAGANVILAEPWDLVVFERTWEKDGLCCVAHSQLVVDLLTSPGRGPAEAEELLQWMKANESAWRQ